MSLHSNDPCHCGSGKKYRQCCMNQDYRPASPELETPAIALVLDWLMRNHGKAYETAILKMAKKILSDDEMHVLNTSYDKFLQASFQAKIYEWLLAEGEIFAKGEMRRLNDYILGIYGPALTPKQREWLAELGKTPFRLYRVTNVVANEQITLCDAMNLEALPVVVHEKLGTQSLAPGDRVGTRVLRVGDHLETSVIYEFDLFQSKPITEQLKSLTEGIADPQEAAKEMGIFLLREWLLQYIREPEYPEMTDIFSGEGTRLVTEHYSVGDWSALERVLAACADVESDGKTGWMRLLKAGDGETRPVLHLSQGENKNTLVLFSTTLTYANQARLWLEARALDLVQFVNREVVDPRGKNMEHFVHPLHPRGSLLYAKNADMPAQMEKTLHRIYSNWADKPLPVIGNKTPRQAMQTPSGLEQVKGLIRGYEANEKRMAEMQQRAAVSFAFMWQSLGLTD